MRIRLFAGVLLASAITAIAVGYVLPAGASGHANRPPVGGPGPSPARFPHMNHVFVIMMENTAYDDLLSPSNANTPFIRSIASTYGLETNYFGVTHVSLPNYLAATSGSNWGSNSDDVAQAPLLDHTNIVDQLERANISWKAYMEDLPAPGDLTTQTADGLYVRKHNPFLMYPDDYNNPARTARGRAADAADDRSLAEQGAAVRLDHPEPVQQHARGSDRLPVPRFTDRRRTGHALPGRERLSADVGHGDHALQGVDR